MQDAPTVDSKAISDGLTLPVMEAYATLQGEGFHTGRSAYFIRLGGCDVGCHWCDVKESWNAEEHELKSITEIVESVKGQSSNMVVITGGEPVMYNLGPLTDQLSSKGYQLHIETSGAYKLTGVWHWICLSPKKNVAPQPCIYTKADELKVIIYNRDDFNWAEQQAGLVGDTCKLYLQPEWGRSKEMLPEITAYLKDNPRWQLSLQTHKYIGLP